MKIARDRKRLSIFDMVLLDIPNQNNIPVNITAKNYVMFCLQKNKLHKLSPIITLGDIFKKNAGLKTQMLK